MLLKEWALRWFTARLLQLGNDPRRMPEELRAERSRRVVLAVVDGYDRREFIHYRQLARKVASSHLRKELTRRLERENEMVRRHARWMLEYHFKHPGN
ncbi:MAG: hypothetical protein J2P21_24790 [Chloracidobacterium sp.]|nr:hypothetical protein [Chloracidobacterium sp.]